MNTRDYTDALAGIGPLAGLWQDAPHLLVESLCVEIERLKEVIADMSEAGDDAIKAALAAAPSPALPPVALRVSCPVCLDAPRGTVCAACGCTKGEANG